MFLGNNFNARFHPHTQLRTVVRLTLNSRDSPGDRCRYQPHDNGILEDSGENSSVRSVIDAAHRRGMPSSSEVGVTERRRLSYFSEIVGLRDI